MKTVCAGSDVTVTPGGPFGSFIQAVRSRDQADLNADVEVGHYSSALCHLGNISLRLGKQVPFDGKKNALGDNTQVVESFNTVRENLKAVGMNLNESTYQLGRTLNLDPKTETFIGDKQANRMLTREYRAPFTVPAKIG